LTTQGVASAGWRLHDYLIGIVGGGGLGAVAGLFIAARLIEGNVPVTMAVAAVVGAIVGVLLMMQTRRNHEGFWTVTTIFMWVVAVASIAFLVLLYDAVRNFN
jgi:ABC-type Fe3+-siderophore transport system permease subunit